MARIRELSTTVVATVVVSSLVATTALLGAGIAGANHPDDAPDMSEHADFTANFPSTSDHYPGDVNEENGSIEYFASGADAFAEQDAEEGVFIDWIIVHAEYEGEDWIDYSACDVPNTEAFGLDRGNNNDGTEYDEDLVSRQKRALFRDDGIVIDFYDWQDIGNDPPYMASEDAIVASQGAGSTDGACLTVTDEPGWYRMAAFMNGTVADNGPDEQPSESAREVSLELNSNNYLYVCECDSEQEAREELGPPPEPGPDPTPTPTESTPEETATATSTPPGGDPGDTDTPDPGTATPPGGDPGGTDTPDPGTTSDGETDGGGPTTPTADEAPGFGAIAALFALLASALLAIRRG